MRQADVRTRGPGPVDSTDVTAANASPGERYPTIEISGLTKVYDERVAVDGLDLTVAQGELFSLLGPNGAGKTTTIRMLCCLTPPTSGSARILGHELTGDLRPIKAAISISPQETAVADHLTAWENLRLMARLHGLGVAETKRRSAELLEMMGLADRSRERVKRFSGGMKRRLSIAMALVSDPDVLFLDEPTLGLDPQSRRTIWEHIEALKGHKTILLTTHYLEEADALADRIAIMDEGRIIALGTADELKSSVADGQVMIVESDNLTREGIDALQALYEEVHETDEGVEIKAETIDLYDIEDALRPRGITVTSTRRKDITLDDVFIELTGREIR